MTFVKSDAISEVVRQYLSLCMGTVDAFAKCTLNVRHCFLILLSRAAMNDGSRLSRWGVFSASFSFFQASA